MKAKRVLSLLLALTLSLTLSPLTLPAAAAEPVAGMGNLSRSGTYRTGVYKDVPANAWYAESAAATYELGLMRGSNGHFSPNGNVTVAQAIAMAARLHARYTTGKDSLVQGDPWYQVYLDYAIQNGMLTGKEFPGGYSKAITRGQMAHVFASALPESELTAINLVNTLPDVNASTPYSKDIFLLYRAGVLVGNDAKGTFTPNKPISRSQAAAIITRLAQSSQRKYTGAIQPLRFTREAAAIQAVGGVEPYGAYWLGEQARVTADLSSSPALAYSLTISDKTSFQSLPAGYDPAALLEWSKGPGLNVDILHRHGFTGKGAVIAYVDQPIASHPQYSGGNLHYINNSGDDSSMHGPAVLSLLAGKDTGTAPEAEVYFYAHAAWKADQTTHAQCLYQIIQQNEKLPEGKKIRMVGFSDNIDEKERNAQAFRDAVAACEKAGIMVWFCAEYGAASFAPLSDKNQFSSLTPDHWWRTGYPADLVFVPTAGRTTAATTGNANYIYWGSGGLSWAMPYVLGLYAIAIEIAPSLTQAQLRQLIVSTAREVNGMRVVDPVSFVAAVLDRAGRGQEAYTIRQEAAARGRYLYAILNSASLTAADQTAIIRYLSTITDATVLVADASRYPNAAALYTALKADAAYRGGTVAGVQIFGTASAVPAFRVDYKVLKGDGQVDNGGNLLTDLFYGNFANDPQRITSHYNVMDHFAQGWNVDLVPQWPVARLPLSSGEFSAFFQKYQSFVSSTGLTRLDLVNFSNPIFAQTKHIDDMGRFLNRMYGEFRLLDTPYRLYGNLDGQYPVTTPVLGNFTPENLARENDAGPMELLINSHGQDNNIDQCLFMNGQEKRVSFLNSQTINQVLDAKPYYLDCWTCLNGFGMADNLTTTALKGRCVGAFTATAIISNNGVNCDASVSQMEKSNFYYFYYQYLKALHEGGSRSQAFFAAQQAYGQALIRDSASAVRGDGNYQFNLYNLLAYHNFGVLEPNAAGSLYTAKGSLPVNSGSPLPYYSLTNGTPVGKSKAVTFRTQNLLASGTGKVYSCCVQALNNGYVRYTLDCLMPAGMVIHVIPSPTGDLTSQRNTLGKRETVTFDLRSEVAARGPIALSIFRTTTDRFWVNLPAYR